MSINVSFRFSAGLAILCALLSGLAACSALPGQGPGAADIIGSASKAPPYEVVQVTPGVIDVLKLRRFDSFATRFPSRSTPVEPLISVGDTIVVTIWEASAGGLFSSPVVASKFSTGSNSATLPEQVVGRDGSITVPYAGRIHVAGRSPSAVQSVIEAALKGKAIEPQVIVNVTHSVTNTATVVGEVTGGGRIPLSVKGDRLLDVLATAGGVRAPVNETFVELTRGSVTSRTPLLQVIAHPAENVYIRPGDVLTFVRAPQTFMAYGATGRNAEVPFEADGITLAEALTKAGGLLDERSDPAGVFVFRNEVYSVARTLRPNSPLVQSGSATPVIYHLNLRDPQGLFLAQRFRIANHDIVYVADSPSTPVQKMFAVIGGGMGMVGSGASIANAAATIK